MTNLNLKKRHLWKRLMVLSQPKKPSMNCTDGSVKKDIHRYKVSFANLLFLPHFNVIHDLEPNRRKATWDLFVKYFHVPVSTETTSPLLFLSLVFLLKKLLRGLSWDRRKVNFNLCCIKTLEVIILFSIEWVLKLFSRCMWTRFTMMFTPLLGTAQTRERLSC